MAPKLTMCPAAKILSILPCAALREATGTDALRCEDYAAEPIADDPKQPLSNCKTGNRGKCKEGKACSFLRDTYATKDDQKKHTNSHIGLWIAVALLFVALLSLIAVNKNLIGM